MNSIRALSGFRLISRFVLARSWIATVAASFVTFYALDMVATSAGNSVRLRTGYHSRNC